MRLTDILTADRVLVVNSGQTFASKKDAIERLAGLLSTGTDRETSTIFKVLADREDLQSTGIGDGVAIPHGSMELLDHQIGAVLLCPQGIEFDSIDGRPARIVIGVVGPKRATGEHLRMLARISRLLRDGNFRERLLASPDGASAFAVIRTEEESRA
jgi:PTS system nitrogen regulatory IIA component